MKLSLVPCSHYWLAVHYGPVVTAICKFPGCRRTQRFTPEGWLELKGLGQALDKPTRV